MSSLLQHSASLVGIGLGHAVVRETWFSLVVLVVLTVDCFYVTQAFFNFSS